MVFDLKFCSTCGVELIGPVKGVKAPNEWVFVFVNHRRKQAGFCRQCYEVIYEGWEVSDE